MDTHAAGIIGRPGEGAFQGPNRRDSQRSSRRRSDLAFGLGSSRSRSVMRLCGVAVVFFMLGAGAYSLVCHVSRAVHPAGAIALQGRAAG